MGKTEVVIGLDIGATNTRFGIVDRNGEIILQDRIDTLGDEPEEIFFERLFEKINDCLSDYLDRYDVRGVGVGAPNANYYTGRIENPPNLSWKSVDVVAFVKKYIDKPTVITNDAKSAALGEMKFGNAKGMKNFIMLTLGTGLGSGIIVNGELVYGHDGFAGEVGHMMIEKDGRICSCGKRGCLEAYVSSYGVVQTFLELIASQDGKSSVWFIPPQQLTSEMIYEAALSGDQIARQAFETTGRILGETLSNLVEYLSPEAIFLFGGLAGAGDFIFRPAMEHMEMNLLPIFRNKVKILPSGLPKEDAAILGSASLIWQKLDGEA